MFTKDDDLAVEFVTAATNLRAHNFSIPLESLFKIKEMAGKIVPAISSSNGLVAALQASEAIKILAGNFQKLRGVSYTRMDKSQRLSSLKRQSERPNPSCKVCTDDSQYLALAYLPQVEAMTLEDLIDTVIKDGLQVDTS